ncbi:MAG: uracil phosphoribosyltransferase [Fimbriimonadaceae bacterium]|nr:uracil phosphoribosyltransferase [Fimbriimonadaceae bacterium]
MPVQVLEHPLGRHLLTTLRDRSTPPDRFRRHAHTLGTLLALESTRTAALKDAAIETPLEPIISPILARPLAIVPILRAGLSLLEPFLELFPSVAVGYVGLERDHATAVASSYYCKLPDLAERTCLCLDPMLATGGSAVQAIQLMKDAGAEDPIMVCVVAAPEGIARLEEAHPGTLIVTASVDRGLNDKSYILPGLGDYGDRLYAT